MIHQQNTKVVPAVFASAVGTTDVTAIVDTLGYSYADFLVVGGTAAATSVVEKLRIGERDGTSGAFSAVMDEDDFDIPAPNTSDVQAISVGVDLKARKRYLQVTLNNAAARTMNVTAILSRAAVSPDPGEDRGLAAELRV